LLLFQQFTSALSHKGMVIGKQYLDGLHSTLLAWKRSSSAP
jgi:hypothetical protein